MINGIQVSSFKPILTTAEQVDEAFRRLAAMGCTTVQLQWIDKTVPAVHIADSLRRHGLRAVSTQDLYETVQSDLAYYLALNRACGCPDLCVSRIPQRCRSAEGLLEYAQELEALAQFLAKEGMTLSFHPVAADYERIGEICPVDRLMQLLPPQITLCLDLYHVHRAGYSLAQMLHRYGARVSMVHMKDFIYLPDGSEALCPAGQGEIQWAEAIDACLEEGVRYAFVEQERWNNDPFDCLEQAYQWMAKECAVREK